MRSRLAPHLLIAAAALALPACDSEASRLLFEDAAQLVDDGFLARHESILGLGLRVPVLPGMILEPALGEREAIEIDEYVLLYNVVADELPHTTPPLQAFQYGFVVDSDGEASNNFAASPLFPADFFDGTDRWFVVSYAPGAGWTLQVTDARNGSQFPLASNARAIISGNTIAVMVPRAELGPDPSYRVTSFRHEGDFGAEGFFNADVVNPVGAPLLKFNF